MDPDVTTDGQDTLLLENDESVELSPADERPPSLLEWWTFPRLFSLVVVGACCAYMFWAVHPELVFRDSTATGGDMGSHVWGPAFMRDFLIPDFALTGWTTDWYAGFPAYLFYMVIPSLAIVILDVGIFDVTSVFGAFASILVAGAAVYGIWWIRNHESRIIRFTAWMAMSFGAILLIDIPYNVAFKMIAVSGLIAFPAGVWYLLKALSLRQPGPELGAIASVVFLMDRFLFHIYGGNMASTMAGEFAFSISITLALFGLGLVANGIRTGRYRARAAMVIGLAVMCHVIPGFFFLVTAAIVIVLLRPAASSWKWALPTGISGGLLALWWYLPFYGRSSFLNDMGWEKLGVQVRGASWARTQLSGALGSAGIQVSSNNPVEAIRFDTNWPNIWRYLFPFPPHEINGQSFDDPNMWMGKFVLALAAVGIVLSLIMMVRAGIFFTIMTLITATAFIFMPQHRFWNARVLPFYYLSLYLLAAIGVVLLLRAVGLVVKGRWVDPPRPIAVGATALVGVIVFVALGMTTRTLPFAKVDNEGVYHWGPFEAKYNNPVRGWAQWNFSGLEAKPGASTTTDADGNVTNFIDTKNSDEFFGMIDMMDEVGKEHGCGRAMWEYGKRLENYGTPMTPMMLPYFTDHCIGSMEGLYFEASSTTPFHFLVQSELSESPSAPQRFDSHLGFEQRPYRSFDIKAGVSHLQMMGVQYYMAFTESAKAAADAEPRLTMLAESPFADGDGDGKPDGSWRVYEVEDTELVVPLENEPVVWNDVHDDIYDYAKPAIDWFNDETQWDVLRATSGPDEWKRISKNDEAPVTPTDGEDIEVTDVETTQDTISFTVSEVGKPVLIRSSYFPNWEVEGADEVHRVAPNFMVVVPTSENVTLTYGRSGLEWFAYLLSLVGFSIFLYFVIRGPGLAKAPVSTEFFGDREVLPDDDEDDALADGVSGDTEASSESAIQGEIVDDASGEESARVKSVTDITKITQVTEVTHVRHVELDTDDPGDDGSRTAP